ncbi:hypothetical protein [Bacillus niameyensis]|uniref:hypothetical protein n=1 Tax=Bacillus niameyensis TaxID=1522308 RepID=UPI0007817DD0|nr:hypothetical protein [Bacillus niameyensis]
MREEIAKVLAMMEEGKLGTEEATDLIQALQEKQAPNQVIQQRDYMDKILKIQAEEKGNKVNVNLPLRLIKVALEAGINIASKIPESAKYTEAIDLVDINLIMDAIENQIEGPIVDITGENGEKVSIVIE